MIGRAVSGPLGRGGLHVTGAEPAPTPAAVPSPLPVTVVVPAYNREALLPRALASIEAQDARPAEVIVVDDASTDATAAVARALGARVVTLAINGGAAAARARGVQEATHPWIALLDSDDEWLPWMLSALWPHRGRHALLAGASVWVSQGAVVRYEGLPFGAAATLDRPGVLVWPQNFIPAAGTLVRRDVLQAAMQRGEGYRYSEDFATWLRILGEHSAYVTARPVVRYHLHAGQKTTSAARLRDQHAIVREVVGPGGQLRRRMRLDAWDEATGRGPAQVRRFLRPGRLLAVAGGLAWRRLQDARCRRLTPAGDLGPPRWRP